MAEIKPIKITPTGDLSRFSADDVVPVEHGGTGVTTITELAAAVAPHVSPTITSDGSVSVDTSIPGQVSLSVNIPIGYTGSHGATGPLGYTGSYGDTGYTGSTGPTGYTGSQGIQGFIGSIGYTGSVGYTGSRGDTGLGFQVAKTYTSVAALQADPNPTGINAGQFALIETGDVNNPENSRIYLWTGSEYSYTTDLSGATGITGPQGYTGSAGVGYTGSAGYTGSRGTTFIDENAPVGAMHGDLWWCSGDGSLKVYYNDGDGSQWVDAMGAQGLPGATGYTGSAGASALTPYDITSSIYGKPQPNEGVMRITSPRSFTIPANCAGSTATSGTAATSSTTFTILKNGVVVGSCVFAAGSATGIYSSTDAIVVQAGDKFRINAPATPDATLADLDIAILANLT